MSKKPYDLEYKEAICRLVIEDGRVVAELSRELNISKATIFRWLRSYKEKIGWYDSNGKRPKTLGESPEVRLELKKENAALKKMIRQIEEENAILKKAKEVFKKIPD